MITATRPLFGQVSNAPRPNECARARTYSTVPTIIQVMYFDPNAGFAQESKPGDEVHSSRRTSMSTSARLMFVANERAAAAATSPRFSATLAIAVGFGIAVGFRDPDVLLSRCNQGDLFVVFSPPLFFPMRPPRRCSMCGVGRRMRC